MTIDDNADTSVQAIVINTPHNPTGKMFSKDELTLIGQLAKQHDALVLADEVRQKFEATPCEAALRCAGYAWQYGS